MLETLDIQNSKEKPLTHSPRQQVEDQKRDLVEMLPPTAEDKVESASKKGRENHIARKTDEYVDKGLITGGDLEITEENIDQLIQEAKDSGEVAKLSFLLLTKINLRQLNGENLDQLSAYSEIGERFPELFGDSRFLLAYYGAAYMANNLEVAKKVTGILESAKLDDHWEDLDCIRYLNGKLEGAHTDVLENLRLGCVESDSILKVSISSLGG
ncbi:hypothetical protein [Pseudobacteriovorax antillogorgiicola]|nr:hypothetical protein [Pseudobacteriovorax antillogorgiicola]